MNIIELQDNLKDLPDSALMQEMQMPTGNMPQFLVLSELKRRKRMRDEYQRQQAADMPTVAEEVMTAAGAPQQGLTAIARNMAPNSSIAQNTSADMAVQREPTRMPQMMADGGILKMAKGGIFAQPTGQGGTYILVQDGERVLGTGIYPNFRSANEAAKSLRGTQPYQTQRILEEPAPILGEEVSELSKVNPDPMAFAANDEARRSLQMRQAMGDFRDPSTDLDIGGILAGAQQFDFDRPFSQDTTTALPVAAPDFDATDESDILDAEEARLVQQEVLDANRGDQPLPDISQIDPETNLDISAALGIGSLGTNLADAMNNPIGGLPFLPPPVRDAREPDATIGSYGRTTVGQTKDEIERMNQILDLAGIGPDTESDVDMIDLMTQAQIEREGFGAGQADDTSGIVSASRRSDREKKGFLDFFPTFGSTGSGRGRGDQVTVGDPLEIPENIEDLMPPINQEEKDRQVRKSRSVIDKLIEEGFTGGDIDPSDIPTQTTETPLLQNVPDQSRSIPEMPIDSSLVMPPMIGDTGGEEPAAPSMPTGTDSYGALESRIAKMLADREKSAETDKYLALAQAGLALMASDSPTLGGALGEAGLVGISQLREARNQYDKDILGLLSTQADIDAARRDASLAERRLGLQEREIDLAEEELRSTSGLTSKRLNEMIDDNRAYLNTLQSEAKSYRRVAEGDEALGTVDRVIDMTPPDLKAKIIAVSERLQELERMRSGQNVQFDATATQ